MGDLELIVGEDGFDSVEISGSLGDYDIRVFDDVVRLFDRMTGERIVTANVEELRFETDTFSFAELRSIAHSFEPVVLISDGTQAVSVLDKNPSISVEIDRLVQELIIEESPGPTIASRAFAMVHPAAYDAWSAYDADAVRVARDGANGNNAFFDSAGEMIAGVHTNLEGAKEMAMAFAAYEVLSDLFGDQQETIDTFMTDRLGYDLETVRFAAVLGRDAGRDMVALRAEDGANQAGDYADTTGYAPVNTAPDAPRTAVDRWTPEYVPIDGGANPQQFLTPHWGGVEPFALPDGGIFVPEPEPFLMPAHADAVLDWEARTLDLNDGNGPQPITRDMIGSVINPAFIEQAEVVIAYSANLDDDGRMSAEFYEDGPGTAFPPGTWMTFGQYVSARDRHSTDDDAKMFMALGNAVFDAGVATWDTKVETDYVRPVRAIRDLGHLGLIGDEDGMIEAFLGYDPVTGESLGTGLIPATEFVTYQVPGGDPSPPFGEYTSGHSGFSAAGAVVLEMFTGSTTFGASVTFDPGSAQFAPNVPAEPVTFAWDTFDEAADAAGESRLFGGVHFTDGDENGRALGRTVGENVYARAEDFWNGTAGAADRPFADDLAMA